MITTVRDIQITYGVLYDIAARLWQYRSALENMQSTIERIDENLQNGEGQTIDALLAMRGDLLTLIGNQHTEVDALFTLFDSYLNEMRAIISASNDGAMTRVSRNNISWSITSMTSSILGISEHGLLSMQEHSITNPLASDDDKARWRSNANRAQLVNDFLSTQFRRLQDATAEMREIHRRYVIPFENLV